MTIEPEPQEPERTEPPRAPEVAPEAVARTHGGAIAMFVLSGIALFIASIADLVADSTAQGIEMPNDSPGAAAAQTAIKIGWPISVGLWWVGLAFTIWVAKKRPEWSTTLVAFCVGCAVGITQIAILGQAASTGS